VSIVERALAKAALARPQAGASAARARADAPPAARPHQDVLPRSVERPLLTADFNANESAPLDLRARSLQEEGLVTPSDMEHLIAEELRVIKRPLVLNADSANASLENGNLIMIGSALPGSGKTFISFNLAASIANEVDWTVLLIDADVSRPTLSRAFGLGDAPGLINLLENDGTSLADYVFPTSHPRLHFLPAGPPRTQAKELLSSQRMRQLVAQLNERSERRIVVFDSPPLLLTSEARVLASYVGQIVVVVEAGVTPRRSLLEAIEMLDPSKAINLVLNKNRQLLGVGDYHYAGYETYGNPPTD
jgi:receptor protein-tyrosine kinase